mmetsp:Transcript_2353/g.4114  ORF Transcript_2353/g.4114 Transcript_2353/m.4114 type:complete len:291 (+) Transcript_2353:1035-1907(+)
MDGKREGTEFLKKLVKRGIELTKRNGLVIAGVNGGGDNVRKKRKCWLNGRLTVVADVMDTSERIFFERDYVEIVMNRWNRFVVDEVNRKVRMFTQNMKENRRSTVICEDSESVDQAGVDECELKITMGLDIPLSAGVMGSSSDGESVSDKSGQGLESNAQSSDGFDALHVEEISEEVKLEKRVENCAAVKDKRESQKTELPMKRRRMLVVSSSESVERVDIERMQPEEELNEQQNEVVDDIFCDPVQVVTPVETLNVRMNDCTDEISTFSTPVQVEKRVQKKLKKSKKLS